jgi:hypothetical protein
MRAHGRAWTACGAVVLAGALAACHQRPPATPVVPDVPPPPPPPPVAICPLAPLALVVTPIDRKPRTPLPVAGSEPSTALSLDDKGRLDISMFRHMSNAATLDPRGCLAGTDGLWAEWAPGDQIWTPHETFAVSANCIVLATGRSLCVAADGKVEVRTPDPADARAMGSLQIRGYRDDARCAGLVLLATFLSMTPSMAVSDGQPARAPAPDGSRCTAYHRP